MRLFIADTDGEFRSFDDTIDERAHELTDRLGLEPAVRVQFPEPGDLPRNAHTWESSAAAGSADLSRLVRLHPSDPVMLIGISSGCRVIHDWLDSNPDQLDRVVAVGMIADPYRPRDRWLPGQEDPGGQGVAGSRLGPIPDRTLWLSVPGDPVSGVEEDSLMRGVVRGSELAPVQVYDQLIEEMPESKVVFGTRLGLMARGQWSPPLSRRVDEARELLRRHRDVDYVSVYTESDGGPSPALQLITGLVDLASRHQHAGQGGGTEDDLACTPLR